MVMWWFHQKPNRVFNLTVVREKKVMSTIQILFFMVCTSISKLHTCIQCHCTISIFYLYWTWFDAAFQLPAFTDCLRKETLEYSNQPYNRINAHPFMFLSLIPTSCDSKRYFSGSLSNCVFHLSFLPEREPLHWIFSLNFSSIALNKIIE